MPAELDLGSLSLRSTSSQLRLNLRSSAKFATSEEDGIDQLQAWLTSCKTDKASSTAPWILRSNDFKLVLHFQLAIGLGLLAQDALVESLATQLREAKMWQQLCFSAPSIRTSLTDGSNDYQLELSLAHAEPLPEQSKRTLHKLGNDNVYYDVEAPEGVLNATVKVIDLAISISTCSHRKRRRCAPAKRSVTLTHAHADAVTLIDRYELTSVDFQRTDSDSIFESDISHSGLSSDCSDVMLEFDDIQGALDDDTMLLDASGSETTACALEAIRGISPFLKRASSSRNLEIEPEQHNTDSVLDLIDACVRLAISDRPQKLCKGVTIEKNALLPLANMAPSLWCPDHLPMTASRAVFLPTIAHAIEGICTKHASTEKLRSKGKQLNDPCSDNILGSRFEMPSNIVVDGACVAPSRALHARVWHSLQRGIYRPEASRRLKPLAVSAQLQPMEHPFEHELLESSQDSTGDIESSDYDDDKDSLLDDDMGEDDHYWFDEDLFNDPPVDDMSASTNAPKEANWGTIRSAQAIDSSSMLLQEEDGGPDDFALRLLLDGVTSKTGMISAADSEGDEDDLLSVCSSL
ncbi:hypothetical protein LTR37_007967 [Vermiconidia calcicola]|uniref:Uncharacterized protein n=1 Tax=Vermiconidia calcicola TaxID=1690605 RepID=A0ACC3NEQ7_9PEZI|nr:hypothetical protein LTR37_007967 [Vermiconidia calcicola]